MTITQPTSSVKVEVIPALIEQEPILSNLAELYAHDFSEFIDLKLGPDGRFGYEHLRLYWTEPDRHPFLILVNGDLAGFVFVQRGSQVSAEANVWDMAEFFIVRGSRRLGVGMRAAHEVWKRFPGKWEVRVINRHPEAREFWARAIETFLGRTVNATPFDKNGAGWQLFSFESQDAT